MRHPGYWQHETSGVLRPAIEAYLNGAIMPPDQISAMRAYLRQWITSPIWDFNPHMSEKERLQLADLRRRIDGLQSRWAIKLWLEDAHNSGHDPL